MGNGRSTTKKKTKKKKTIRSFDSFALNEKMRERKMCVFDAPAKNVEIK